jgi:glycosyltransferase involved in cell wall biosynthesis
VLAQEFEDYEVIVVNDGSPDTAALEQALKPYAGRVVYLAQENGGPGRARNTAIRASRGRYIALLDADDLWEPGYLSAQVAALERDPTLDVVYSDGLIFGDGPGAGNELMTEFPSPGEVTFESVLTCECTVLISAVMRREAVERAGLFDESLRGTEDFDLWLRILKQGGRIGYHRQPLARYRRVRGSLSSSKTRMYRQALAVFDKVGRTMTLDARERDALERTSARFRAMLRLEEGKEALARNDTRAAIDGLKEANEFFNSGKLRLALLLLRLAPRALQLIYGTRRRFLVRTGT